MDISNFDNKHQGQRGFVIGGGPSIRFTAEDGFDFDVLKSEITVGANKAYKLFTPTYLVWGDKNFYRRYKQDIQKLECTMFLSNHDTPGEEDAPKDDPRFIRLQRVLDGHGRHHVPTTFAGPVSFWQNSGLIALRIAYLLGLNPIYLLGMDLKKFENAAWFHDGYDFSKGPGENWFNLVHTNFVRFFEQVEGVDIYSCSSISSLNKVIPYVDIKTLFPSSNITSEC